ncbi:MAG TPA: transporter substrate-binding domain-containing protein [Terriglobia bacterium]|nr:transporter substrate-binding domain-containing protein [Terriglobia bacterium]
MVRQSGLATSVTAWPITIFTGAMSGAPALRYYAAHEGNGRVRPVGPEFSQQGIGFVFPFGDPLRRNVSPILLAIREDGTYQRLYDKWFGAEP